jgi:hypothetical protein
VNPELALRDYSPNLLNARLPSVIGFLGTANDKTAVRNREEDRVKKPFVPLIKWHIDKHVQRIVLSHGCPLTRSLIENVITASKK